MPCSGPTCDERVRPRSIRQHLDPPHCRLDRRHAARRRRRRLQRPRLWRATDLPTPRDPSCFASRSGSGPWTWIGALQNTWLAPASWLVRLAPGVAAIHQWDSFGAQAAGHDGLPRTATSPARRRAPEARPGAWGRRPKRSSRRPPRRHWRRRANCDPSLGHSRGPSGAARGSSSCWRPPQSLGPLTRRTHHCRCSCRCRRY